MENVFYDREGVCPMEAIQKQQSFESSIPSQYSDEYCMDCMGQTSVRGDAVFDPGEPLKPETFQKNDKKCS